MAFPIKFGSGFLVNTTTIGSHLESSITGLADGRFVVSWTDQSATGDDTSFQDVRAQIYDPREAAVVMKGTKLGDDLIGTK